MEWIFFPPLLLPTSSVSAAGCRMRQTAAAAAAPPQPEFSLRSRAQHTTSATCSAAVSPQHVWIGGRIRSAVDPSSKDKSHRIDGREPLVSAAGFIYLHSTNRLQRNSDHCRELYFVCTWRVKLRPVMSWQAKTRGKLPCNIRSCSDWSAKNIRCVWAWTKWGTITRLLA